MHGQQQQIECPGCGHGPFPRVSTLMAHIELGECGRITTDMIEEMRAKKFEFPRALEQLTQSTVKNNYSKYMPSSRHGNYNITSFKENDSWGQNKEDIDKIKDESLIEKTSLAGHQLRRLRSVHESGPTEALSDIGLHDPGNPGFKVSQHYCPISERFNCPKTGCG